MPGTHNTKFGKWVEVETLVNSPVRYELDDLEEWISETSPVILRKNLESGKRLEVRVDLKKVMQLKTEDVLLQPSDILFVPDSSGKRALHRAGDTALALTTGVALVSATKF